MTTYGTQTATTTWKYSPTRGWLDRKEYDDGKGTDYAYTLAGRLKTRTWARGNHTRYDYDPGGRLTHTRYFLTEGDDTGTNEGNDPDTPDVAITYDALNRQETQSNGIATSEYHYDPATLAIDTETVTYTLAGLDIFTRIIDHGGVDLGRPTGWQIIDEEEEEIEHDVEYRYHATAGRLHQIESPAGTFTYGYEDDSQHLLATITGPVHTVTNTWEASRNVLETKTNEATTHNASIPSTFHYTVNAIGQRTALRPLLDGNDNPVSTYSPSWDWDYNSSGEIVEAADKAGTNDRAYQFDGIGNREKTVEDLFGALVSAPENYTANALNQYTEAEGETLPSNPYDLDGNLHFDGGVNTDKEAREYVWDAENRLITVVRVSGGTTLASYRYDAQSRLISSTVGTETTLYIYDGWNRIAEYAQDGTGHALNRTYTWGMDLSGSMQGAGGVSGLLAVRLHGGDNAGHYFPTYDGNGNISEYLDHQGVVKAHYEYDPFGNDITPFDDKGDLHNLFTYRFSTKPMDSITGWFYYGYRYYDPVTGRWPSRDPIEERGGLNLYGFVGNNGVNWWDLLGFIKCDCENDVGKYKNLTFVFTLEFTHSKHEIKDPKTYLKSFLIEALKEGVESQASKTKIAKYVKVFKDATKKSVSKINEMGIIVTVLTGAILNNASMSASIELCVESDDSDDPYDFVKVTGYGATADTVVISLLNEPNEFANTVRDVAVEAAKDLVRNKNKKLE